jgi:hypothetical protein
VDLKKRKENLLKVGFSSHIDGISNKSTITLENANKYVYPPHRNPPALPNQAIPNIARCPTL